MSVMAEGEHIRSDKERATAAWVRHPLRAGVPLAGRLSGGQFSRRCPVHIQGNQWIPVPTRTTSCCSQWPIGDFMAAAEGEQPHWEQRVRRIAPDTVSP